MCNRVQCRGPVLRSLIVKEFALAWVLLPAALGRRVLEISLGFLEISDLRAVPVQSRVQLHVIDAAEQGISRLIAEKQLVMVVSMWVT